MTVMTDTLEYYPLEKLPSGCSIALTLNLSPNTQPDPKTNPRTDAEALDMLRTLSPEGRRAAFHWMDRPQDLTITPTLTCSNCWTTPKQEPYPKCAPLTVPPALTLTLNMTITPSLMLTRITTGF